MLRRQLFASAIVVIVTSSLLGADWPQWLGPQRDGVWKETGILERFPKGGPRVRWRTEVGGGFSGPAVAEGRVYLTDRILNEGAKNPNNAMARAKVPGKERVLCFDETTGKLLWKHEYPVKYDISYPCGPRCTPIIHEGRVYTLGAMGDLLCLDVGTGKVVWSVNFPRDYKAPVPLWGFAAHPLLDGDKLICLVGGEKSVVVAFDANTGKEKWKALTLDNPSSELGYCPPMIYKAGGVRQLIIWHPEAVCSLDPETGKEYWSQPFRIKANLAVSTPQLSGDMLLITSFYNGSMGLKLNPDKPEASVVWKSAGRGENPKQTDSLHSIMATPYIRDGYFYGVCSYGELRCLRLADGKRIWEDLRATGKQNEPVERWANSFLTPQGDRWFLFNEKGELIIARLSPKGYEEIDRAHLLDPTGTANGRKIVWSHPAYANKCVFVRNDKELVCVSLAAE